jgi:hypothetical protein
LDTSQRCDLDHIVDAFSSTSADLGTGESNDNPSLFLEVPLSLCVGSPLLLGFVEIVPVKFDGHQFAWYREIDSVRTDLMLRFDQRNLLGINFGA